MKRGILVANIDLNEYQLTYKQIGQLYDFKKDGEIVKGTTAIFDDKTKNYHLYPKDKQHCQEIADDLTDLITKIKEEIKVYKNIFIVKSKKQLDAIKDNENIYIFINTNGTLKKENKTICNIFKYIVVKKNNVLYELNFMRFYLSKPNTINCILRSIQFARITDNQKIYPYTYKAQTNKSLKKLLSNNQSFFYNPKLKINQSPKIIIDSFLQFITFCETQSYELKYDGFKYAVINNSREAKLKQLYWNVAFGLQKVDGLKPSQYMIDLAKANIDGKKTFKEVEMEIKEYYYQKENVLEKEADLVSIKIVQLLNDDTFSFDYHTYCTYHKLLFSDLNISRKYTGNFRDYNITKAENILNGATVNYTSYFLIKDTLEYDFNDESNYDYTNKSIDDIIKHLAAFTANIWQVHPFVEGNTRTMAIFILKYLHSLNFKRINIEIFKDNSKYFRNALVRANYRDTNKGIDEDNSFLVKFFSNLLLAADYKLDNEELNID